MPPIVTDYRGHHWTLLSCSEIILKVDLQQRSLTLFRARFDCVKRPCSSLGRLRCFNFVTLHYITQTSWWCRPRYINQSYSQPVSAFSTDLTTKPRGHRLIKDSDLLSMGKNYHQTRNNTITRARWAKLSELYTVCRNYGTCWLHWHNSASVSYFWIKFFVNAADIMLQ